MVLKLGHFRERIINTWNALKYDLGKDREVIGTSYRGTYNKKKWS